MEEFEMSCGIRCYQLYCNNWDAMIGEEVWCVREPYNESDRYAVAVIKDDIVITYLPRNITWVCSLFLCRGGVLCTVTGSRRYSANLSQGGPAYFDLKHNIRKFRSLKHYCCISNCIIRYVHTYFILFKFILIR